MQERGDDISARSIREQVIEGIMHIPESKLQILLELIRDYKKGKVVSVKTERSIADFAETWKDIIKEHYSGLTQETALKRKRK